jgi:hypothetical protein
MYHDVKEMAKQIEKIKKETIRLGEMAGDIQCVDRNVERIMASIKMLEINISDLVI